MRKKKSLRNLVLGGLAAVALTVVTATPAFAGSASGYRSCTAPKSVTLSSITPASYGYHQYTASGQVIYIYNPNPGYPFSKQTYGSPTATNWSIWVDAPLTWHAASCI